MTIFPKKKPQGMAARRSAPEGMELIVLIDESGKVAHQYAVEKGKSKTHVDLINRIGGMFVIKTKRGKAVRVGIKGRAYSYDDQGEQVASPHHLPQKPKKDTIAS